MFVFILLATHAEKFKRIVDRYNFRALVDADLYTIHEDLEMLTLVKPHRIQRKCSVKNKNIE